MNRFFAVCGAMILLFALSACAGSQERRDENKKVYKEIHQHALTYPELSSTLDGLGTQKSLAPQNRLNSAGWMSEKYTCRDITIRTPKGFLDVSFCVPWWYLGELPGVTLVTFVYEPRMVFWRPVYMGNNPNLQRTYTIRPGYKKHKPRHRKHQGHQIWRRR